jgi:DNA-binding Lrp family transcriptional regulator
MDEADIALVDALQVNPRARFEDLAVALEMSPVTVARRWRNLFRSGRAWVSSVPGPQLRVTGAVFEAACVPGRVREVAAALAAYPQVFSVHLISGSYDLYALVVAADRDVLSELLVDMLPVTPGLTRVRTTMVTEMFSGPDWRLGAISARQAATLNTSENRTNFPPVTAAEFDGFNRGLFLAMQDDGRLSYRDLGERLGKSEQAVKRRVSSLTSRGLLAFRTDFARTEGGWPAQVSVWLEVSDDALAAVASGLSQWPPTRVCASAIGSHNLFVTLQLHDVADLRSILTDVSRSWPQANIRERHVILRSVKSWGRLLDDRGHAVGVIPVDPWAHALPR